MKFEELLEPYLKDTDIGLPYWDWTKNTEIPDLWLDIPSPVKQWNEKRNTDFGRFSWWTINRWRRNCQSPTTNIGEYALRNKDLNVLGNQKQSLIERKNDAMESEDIDIFAENIEVWKNIVSKTKKSCNTD